jgi:hypothetical protein
VAHSEGVFRVRVNLVVLFILLLKVPHPLGAFGTVFVASVELRGPLWELFFDATIVLFDFDSVCARQHGTKNCQGKFHKFKLL